MDPKFVNLLIKQFISKTTCPQCASPILPNNVKIENVGKDKCIFTMQCDKCKAVIAADAHLAEEKETFMQKSVEQQEKKTPPPQKKVPKNIRKQSVSLDDLMQIKKQIKNFSGNFKTLFG